MQIASAKDQPFIDAFVDAVLSDRLNSGCLVKAAIDVSEMGWPHSQKDSIQFLKHNGLLETHERVETVIPILDKGARQALIPERQQLEVDTLCRNFPAFEALSGEVRAQRLAPVAEALSQMESAREGGDVVAFHKADITFHRELSQIAGPKKNIADLIELNILKGFISNQTSCYVSQEPPEVFQEGSRVIIGEHRDILEAVRSGQMLKAKELLEKHIKDNETVWLRASLSVNPLSPDYQLRTA